LTVNVLPAIVSVPLRDEVAEFTSTVNDAVPPPDPFAPAVTVIHPVLLTVVHAHPVAADTVADPDPPAAPVVSDDGEILGAHAAPASLTVKVLPPIVSVPLRGVVDGFGSTVNEAVPFPEPFAPAVTVIQPVLLTVVHVHPVTAETVADPDPPPAAAFNDAGEIVGAHEAPASLTVKV
jgi:hypothetical protein